MAYSRARVAGVANAVVIRVRLCSAERADRVEDVRAIVVRILDPIAIAVTAGRNRARVVWRKVREPVVSNRNPLRFTYGLVRRSLAEDGGIDGSESNPVADHGRIPDIRPQCGQRFRNLTPRIEPLADPADTQDFGRV